MKEIKILRLEIENFKCHKNLVLEFNGENASVYGDNGTGKTSIYDALTWLLFGKDSRGNGEKNIEIKPLTASGEVADHLGETAVTAVLLIDGEEISLKRTQKEVWTTKRGGVEATYDGNTSEYFIDGVPVKKYMFSEKVDELVNEDTFKMLTSVSYFASDMNWQDRRAVLFRVASVASDEEIMATDERFEPLIKSKGRLPLEDYKKKLLSDKRGLSVTKGELPARISECEKTVADVSSIDFGAARAEAERISAAIAELTKERTVLESDAASIAKEMEIKESRLALERLNHENYTYRESRMRFVPDVSGMKRNLENLKIRLEAARRSLENEKALTLRLDVDIEASRARWIATNGEMFTGGSCPTCGQALPKEQLGEAEGRFNQKKRERLHEIEETANAHKSAKAAAEDRIKRSEELIGSLEVEIKEAEAALKLAETQIITPCDIEGYAEAEAALKGKISALTEELSSMRFDKSAVRGKIDREILALRGEEKVQRETVGKEALLEYSKKRIEELRGDAKNTAAMLEAIERELFLIDEFTRYKTKFVENSINCKFKLAKFRLFREQANGGVEDRCDVVYDGIPYINVNNGMQINLGIDIINTLSECFGVRVPLFIDNAESVTRLENYNGQIIRLVVSERDKEIRVDYED